MTANRRQTETIVGPLYRTWEEAEKRRRCVDVIPTPEIFVKVKIYSLGKIDMEEGMCFDIDFAIMMDWIDPSVIDVEGLNIEKNHFSPLMSIHNCEESNPSLVPGGNPNCRLQQAERGVTPVAGHVKKTQRYKTKISLEAINLEHYPFDSHDLVIKLKGDHLKLTSASIAGEEECMASNPRYRFDNCFHEKEKENNRQEWQIMDFKDDKYTDSEQKKGQSSALSPHPQHKARRQDELWIKISIRRNLYGKTSKMFIQYFLCLALSLSSFMLLPTDLAGRLGLVASVLLALVSFRFENEPSRIWTISDSVHNSLLSCLFFEAVVHALIFSIKANDREELVKFFNCGATSSSVLANECSEALCPPPAVPPHTPSRPSPPAYFSFFLVLFVYNVSSSLWNRVGRGRGSLQERFRRFLAFSDQVLYQVKLLTKAFAKMFLAFVFPFGVATLSSSGLNPLPAVWHILCALARCMVGNCNGQNNPHMCEESTLHVFQLLFSDTALFLAVISLIAGALVIFIADITLLYYSPGNAYIQSKNKSSLLFMATLKGEMHLPPKE